MDEKTLYKFEETGTAGISGNGHDIEEEADDTLQVILNVSDYQERIRGLSGKSYRTLETSGAAQAEFLSRFMVDERGRYLTEEAAYQILDELTVDDISEAFQQLQESLQEAAVPKKSGKQSSRARISTCR